ncbi:MAG: hypothetical protein GXY36_08440 [Chloroflexi bacterium]|nr:hypothetical protein [Chloroflexota bacterium]
MAHDSRRIISGHLNNHNPVLRGAQQSVWRCGAGYVLLNEGAIDFRLRLGVIVE